MNSNVYVYRLAKLKEIISLRHEILIVGTQRTSSEFPGDLYDTTFHFGAFAEDRAVACLSWMKSEWEGEAAYRLRGMAVDAGLQKQGIGGKLLAFSESYLKEKGAGRVWCNARSRAVVFYERQGWEVVSEEFSVPGVGPHYKMIKRLDRAQLQLRTN